MVYPHSGMSFSNKMEWSANAFTTWVHPKDIMLSESSQKGPYVILVHWYEMSKKDKSIKTDWCLPKARIERWQVTSNG